MPKATRPEGYWDEKRQEYVKKIKDPNGRWIKVYGKTIAELRKNRKEKEDAFALQLDLRENPPVWVYAQQWYRLHTGGYSKKRQQDYANAINNHICPVIGKQQIRDVTYSDIQLIMANSAKLSKSSQQKIVTSLRRIFEAAVADKIILESPCRGLRPGGQDAQEKVALTKKQQEALLEAVRGLPIETFVRICLYAGLRREEALGLQWSNVVLDGSSPHINVRSSCNWEGKNQATLTELLKSEAAYRTIPIPPQLVDCLRQAQGAAGESRFVISREGDKLLTASAFRRRWDAIPLRTVRVWKGRIRGKDVERQLKLGDTVPFHPGVTVSLNFHVTPHLLRHTYISELILAGVSVKRVQYLAGHSSPVETLKIYTHLMENRPEDLIADVLKTFSPDAAAVPTPSVTAASAPTE